MTVIIGLAVTNSNKVPVNELDKKAYKLAPANTTYYGTLTCTKPKFVRKIDLCKEFEIVSELGLFPYVKECSGLA